MALPEFPIGDTLDGGAWQVTGQLRRGGTQDLCLAERTGRPGERAMVSVIWAPRGVPADLRAKLCSGAVGVLPLEHLGPFDVAGDDGVRESQQRQHIALVERLPPGERIEWLPRAIAGRVGAGAAFALGASVGAILARAAAAGVLLVGVRPDYVWVRRDGDRLTAAGLTGRNWDFFAHTGGGCLAPAALFERHYCAPEVYQDRGEGEESLVFTLAIMIAEWATGSYPFPDSWVGGNMRSLVQGRHAPLDLAPDAAALLGRGLRASPAERPPLAEFLAAAERLITRAG
jgi:hypothetical protein